MRRERVEDLSCEPARSAHAVERLGPVKLDHSVSRFGAVVVGRDFDILGHWLLDTHSTVGLHVLFEQCVPQRFTASIPRA